VEVSGIISAIVVGLIIGALARLAVPGRQRMGILATLLLGLVGAFIGAAIGYAITNSFVVVLILQVAVAAVGVYLYAGSRSRHSAVR
jgi:uncharacterized membrane protein YeaQ/YmgE (transglycosylase-associated protein family)